MWLTLRAIAEIALGGVERSLRKLRQILQRIFTLLGRAIRGAPRVIVVILFWPLSINKLHLAMMEGSEMAGCLFTVAMFAIFFQPLLLIDTLVHSGDEMPLGQIWACRLSVFCWLPTVSIWFCSLWRMLCGAFQKKLSRAQKAVSLQREVIVGRDAAASQEGRVALLLRPASPVEAEILLRPASPGSGCEPAEQLLRPVDGTSQ